MTSEERIKAEAWARWAAEQDGGADVSVGGLAVTLEKFPPPITEGLTPAEAEAALAAWRVRIADWVRETNRQFTHPVTQPVSPVRASPPPPEVPAS
jgi:hypothetical protein